MSYQVIARKYRPQAFDEVIGQPVVTKTLSNAIESGRIAHAFLFSGVRGVGKTTTARILAKALNCHQGLSARPCGKCDSCLEIAASRSVDVQEIDAASNTGVDSIRELRESVRYGTARDRHKIYIIDEVHMLSNAAFNALLKTLEEPPEHVKFVMATTEPHKIPVTITSRCQHFEFKPIQFAEILGRLKDVVEEEGIEISEYALRAIANEGRGSMRDAQSALDQILSYGGKKISDEDVGDLLGVVDESMLSEVAEAVLGRDRTGVLEHMQKLLDSGGDPRNFCRELIQHVRNLMVCKAAGWDERLLHLPDTQRKRVEEQAERFSRLDLIRFYDLLSQTHNELRWHSRPYVHLEIALMKLVEVAGLADIEEVIGRMGEGGSHAKTQRRKEEREIRGKRGGRKEAGRGEETAEDEESREEGGGSEGNVVPRLLEAVHSRKPDLAGLLPERQRIRYDKGVLSLTFPPGGGFQRNLVEREDNRKVLGELCAKIAGSAPRLEIREEEGRESAPEEEIDPEKDPKVKAFLEQFPGKYSIEKE